MEKINAIIQDLSAGFDKYVDRVLQQKQFYTKLLQTANEQSFVDGIWRISDELLLEQILEIFNPALLQQNAKNDLLQVYEAAIHQQTGALIIANKGATLYSISPIKNSHYLTRHIGLTVYMPGIGVEYVNAGLIGDVYNGKIVVRSESACAPSFYFHSQRCNCCHQWNLTSEVAAHFNQINVPDIADGAEFEKWVQSQLTYENGKHIFKNPGKGFVLLHVDTQNGMGSGYSKGEFVFDLYNRASIRHRGEYTSEQIFQTSMLGGFEAIGLKPDPRSENDNIGYKITPVVLDYLSVSKDIIFLTNNPLKIKVVEEAGYVVDRKKIIGMVNIAGVQEAAQRGSEFGHQDICGLEISFDEEFDRLTETLSN